MADHTIVVPNGETSVSGRKRWRWEHRDHHGHLLACGQWETNPVRAVRPALDAQPAAIAAVDVGDSMFDLPRDELDVNRPDLARAAADARG